MEKQLTDLYESPLVSTLMENLSLKIKVLSLKLKRKKSIEKMQKREEYYRTQGQNQQSQFRTEIIRKQFYKTKATDV